MFPEVRVRNFIAVLLDNDIPEALFISTDSKVSPPVLEIVCWLLPLNTIVDPFSVNPSVALLFVQLPLIFTSTGLKIALSFMVRFPSILSVQMLLLLPDVAKIRFWYVGISEIVWSFLAWYIIVLFELKDIFPEVKFVGKGTVVAIVVLPSCKVVPLAIDIWPVALPIIVNILV